MRSLPSVLDVFFVILCTRHVFAKPLYAEPKPPSVVNGRPRSEVDLETEKQFIVCAGQNKSLECLSPGSTISIQDAFWGRLSDKICPSEDGDPVTNCENDPATLRIVKGLCDEKRACEVSAKHTVLQSPGTKHCPGVNKYMEVNYMCMPEMKKFVLCNGETTILHCGQGWKINILSVYWGRDSPATCPTPLGQLSHCGSEVNSFQALKSLCQGLEQCSVRADDEHFSFRQDRPHCPAVDKYAVISFQCQPLVTDDNLTPNQMRKQEDDTNNNSTLTAVRVTPLRIESVGLQQNQEAPVLSQPLHDVTFNITVLPIPQYDRNTSAKLAPLFAYLNGDKTAKNESRTSLLVPQDNHTEVNEKNETSTTPNPRISANKSLSAAQKSREDTSPEGTEANEQILRESASLNSANNSLVTALKQDPRGGTAHGSYAPPINGSSSGVLAGSSQGNDAEDDQTGTHLTTSTPPAKAVTAGTIAGAQSQAKEPSTAQNISANKSLSAADRLREDTSRGGTEANEQILHESASLNSAHNSPVTALKQAHQGGMAHDSYTLLTNGSSSGVLGSSQDNDTEDDKTGTHLTTSTPPAKAVTAGTTAGAQSQLDKNPSTAQRISEDSTTSSTYPTKLTPQGTNLATGKLDDLVQKQSKELCLVSQRHICPTAAVQSLRPNGSHDDKVVTQMQTKTEKTHWSAMVDLAKQIQNTNNEAETMKTLNEKVDILEALSNALTTLTSKYFLEEKNKGKKDHSQRQVKAYRHNEQNQQHEANLLGSLFTWDDGRLLVPKREKNVAESTNSWINSGYLMPKEVDILQNKINQAIVTAEASNRQSVFPHPPKDKMRLLHHLTRKVTKDENAHAREISDKLMPQNESKQGKKNVENVHGIVKTFNKKAVGKGSTRKQAGHPIESIVQNVSLRQNKSLQDGGDRKGEGFLVGREVRESAKEKDADVGEQVKNMTNGNTTMPTLTAINTVITPSRGITLGGRINTETQIKTQGIGEQLLKAMGTILSRHNKTVAKSANFQVQGEPNCAGTSCNSKHVAQGQDLKNREASETSLKSSKVTHSTPLEGRGKSGTERGAKYTNIKILHPGKRLAVGTQNVKLQNLKTMIDLEQGIDKLMAELPNDHRPSDLPKSEALSGAPTDKESGKASPNNAVKLLQNIAIQLRKTLYLFGKTKAMKARVREGQTETNSFRKRLPSDSSSMSDTNQHGRPFFSISRKIHLVREKPKTRNAWETSSIPHVVEFHSGITMGKIAGLEESKPSDTSPKDASLLSEDKITTIPQFSHVMGGNSHRTENVNLGGAILAGDDKNSASTEPTTSSSLAQTVNDKNGLLSVPQLNYFTNGTQGGLTLSVMGPTQDHDNSAEGTTRLSVSTDVGKGEQLDESSKLFAQNSTEVKELVFGISNLVKLLSGKSLEKNNENNDKEENDLQTAEATSEGTPIAEDENEYTDKQYMSPETNSHVLATSMNDDSQPESESTANDDYISNQANNHSVTASSMEADSPFNSPNDFKIDDIGGRYTEYKDDSADDSNYGNEDFENHMEDDVNGDDMHDNWDGGYAHAQKQLKSNPSDARVDSFTVHHPTKKSPVIQEYENLPSQIRDLDDPRLKDDGVVDYVEGIVDKENTEATNELMNLSPKAYKRVPTRKSNISHRILGAVVAPPQRDERQRKRNQPNN